MSVHSLYTTPFTYLYTPCTLLPVHYSLYLTPCTLYTPCTLPVPYSLWTELCLLLDGVAVGSSITSLDVSHNNGGPLSTIELTQVCGQDQLTELDASWNTLRGEDSSALVLAVAGNMTLTALNVSFNALGRRCPTDDWSTMFTKNKVKWFIIYEYINRYIGLTIGQSMFTKNKVRVRP